MSLFRDTAKTPLQICTVTDERLKCRIGTWVSHPPSPTISEEKFGRNRGKFGQDFIALLRLHLICDNVSWLPIDLYFITFILILDIVLPPHLQTGMDLKKIHPEPEQHWDSNVEQEIFGNQAPYAAGSSTQPDLTGDFQDHLGHHDPNEEAPYLAYPYQPESTTLPQKSIHPIPGDPTAPIHPFTAASSKKSIFFFLFDNQTRLSVPSSISFFVPRNVHYNHYFLLTKGLDVLFSK